MKLLPPTREQCQEVILWRNECMESLRTPFFLTEEMQDKFYDDVVSSRNAKHRYYAMMDGDKFVAMGGITNIEWENSAGELSLIVNPKYRRKGYGKNAVKMFLDEAFNKLNLATAYGEVYMCNPAIGFWKSLIKELGWYETVLPRRKFWGGKYYDSVYFSIVNPLKGGIWYISGRGETCSQI